MKKYPVKTVELKFEVGFQVDLERDPRWILVRIQTSKEGFPL